MLASVVRNHRRPLVCLVVAVVILATPAGADDRGRVFLSQSVDTPQTTEGDEPDDGAQAEGSDAEALNLTMDLRNRPQESQPWYLST